MKVIRTAANAAKYARLLLTMSILPATPIYAGISGPYTNDAHTVYLFHLDEASGSGTAAWEGSGGGTGAYTVDNSASEVTDVLGATGYFGGAANMWVGSTDRGIGIDVDSPTDGFEYGDEIHFGTIISNGQFTLEALVKPSVSDLSDHGHIWSMDSGNGSRGFQFRLNSSEELEWHPINMGGSGPVTVSVGAITADSWYHAAITYSNGNYTMYWTPLSGSYSEAQVLHTWTSALTDTSVAAELVLGNEGRSNGGEFVLSFADDDGDGLPDGWEQQVMDDSPGDAIEDIYDVNPNDDYDGDGITNRQEYELGFDPTTPLDPMTDSDGDYLPDAWEYSNFTNLTYNAYDDPDSDDYNNQAERIGETDPLVDTDYPDFMAPSVAFMRDSVVATNACLMGGGIYGRAINGLSFQDQILHTFDGYQYTAYYDTVGSVQMVSLARRTVDEAGVGEWEIIQTDSEFTRGDESSWDAHNVITFGICEQDGTLHVAWDHHGHNLRYRRSVAGLCTTNKAAWGAGMLNSEQNWLVTSGQTETVVTYPQFIATLTGGLVLDYRYGGSGNGDQYLHVYNPATGTWTDHIKFTDRSGDYNGSTSRCAYINGLDFDPGGTIHVTWTWREGANTPNHDICYAYSPDMGTNWYNNGGTNIADTGLGESISLDSPGIIIKGTDQNHLMINQQAQCVDNDARVHALMIHRREDPGYEYPNYSTADYSTYGVAYYHYFRDPGTGAWTQRRIPPDAYPVGSRPCIGYDAQGNVYAAYLSYPAGTDVFPGYRADDDVSPLVIASASKVSAYTDWEILQVVDGDFDGEPLLDQARLLSDGILAVYIQEHDTYTSGDGIPTPLHVYEYAVDIPEPSVPSDIAYTFMEDDMLISTFGQKGSNYQLQVSMDLTDTNGWSKVGDIVGGMDSLIAFPAVDGLQNTQSFYKVLSTPMP